MSDIPHFSRRWDEKIHEGQKVYVIDHNGYDIYEAVIEVIYSSPTRYLVFYPEYETREEIFDKNLILCQNKINRSIFTSQENIRNLRENSTTASSAHENSDRRKRKGKNEPAKHVKDNKDNKEI